MASSSLPLSHKLLNSKKAPLVTPIKMMDLVLLLLAHAGKQYQTARAKADRAYWDGRISGLQLAVTSLQATHGGHVGFPAEKGEPHGNA